MKVSALVEIRYFDGRPPSLCARLESAGTVLDLPITLEQAAFLLQNGAGTPDDEEDEEPAPPPSRRESSRKATSASPMARVEPEDDEDEDDDL